MHKRAAGGRPEKISLGLTGLMVKVPRLSADGSTE